eukprot:CAMPEP_0172560680 /NCGR_PEP_ID=MMETSP1067-20121228/89752_1 /TAXON_ID=265564 ORGANISM="Thalassiosira punctigera, Strain Tpunct2005C2" /NCGR_SAMPLE_ID=MMETSP1067 /ASSEMBLY_ACC=CAM_ASM_000444 /LENGTH=243 /DNA_ID=CAMNT_0013350531 /DNA_START=98 /DNA_END=826 /DNA_ORIENTATION=-
MDGLSPQAISRHLPPSSVGEVLPERKNHHDAHPRLWVGNLMSITHLADLVQKSTRDDGSTIPSERAFVTVISVLSNKNMIRFAADALQQQRPQHPTEDAKIPHNNSRCYNQTPMDIKHVIIPLKDTVDSDLMSALPNALLAIDEALGVDANEASFRDDAAFNHTTNACARDKTSTNDGNNHSSLRNENDFTCQTRVCLVHCAKGASRSVSLVIAYLLSRHSQRFRTFEDALSHVRSVQPQAMP